jgi:probable blue pigment (indigoidine) exporter
MLLLCLVVKYLDVKILDMKTNGPSPIALATVLAPVSWGTTYVTVTELLPAGRPLLVATMRVLPAGLLLLVAGAVRAPWRPRGRAWAQVAALAFCNFGLFFPLLVVAVYRLPGGVAASVGGVQPLLVALVSWLVTRQRPRARDIAVGVAAAVGVGLVVVRPDAAVDAVGVLAALGANVSFSLGVVLTRHFPTPPNRLMATGWQLLLSGLALVPLALAVEGTPATLTPANIAGFAYLSVAATSVAFLLWFNGIRRLPVAAPPLLGLAAPLTGAAMGWVLLGQALAASQLTGFVVTIGAIGYGALLRDPTDRRSTASSPEATRTRHRRPRQGAPRPVRPGPAGCQVPVACCSGETPA